MFNNSVDRHYHTGLRLSGVNCSAAANCDVGSWWRGEEGDADEFMIISSGVAAITVITRAGRLCLA